RRRAFFLMESRFAALRRNARWERGLRQSCAMRMRQPAISPHANRRALVRAARGARRSPVAANRVRDASADPACAADLGDQQIANVANGFAAKMLEIVSAGVKLLNESESFLCGTIFDGGDEFVENFLGDDAEQFAYLRVCDFVAAVGNGLFEKREPVA